MAVMLFAWKGWGWASVVENLPGTEELLALYAPMEEVLVEAGMVYGVQGLLAATALLGIGYPLIEGDRGKSGKVGVGTAHWPRQWHGRRHLVVREAFRHQFIRPVLGALAGVTGLGMLGWLAGPAGLVISLGTLLLLAPTVKHCTTNSR